MDNALWNSTSLSASEVAKHYPLEKEVRRASGHKALRCPDPECRQPVLRYCHGEIKDAYFAHRENAHCDYADFDRANTGIMRTVRRTLYEHFKNKGYSVRTEVKVLPRHYTHLLFEWDDGSCTVVEIETHHLSANRLAALTRDYRAKGIPVRWLVIGSPDTLVRESKTYFIKRYLLNESPNRDLLVVAWNGQEVTQYKADRACYEHNGFAWDPGAYPETYAETASLDRLAIENGEITLPGFHDRYGAWLEEKQVAFNEEIRRFDEKNRHKEEEIARLLMER